MLPYHLEVLFSFVYRAPLGGPQAPFHQEGFLQKRWCSWQVPDLGSGQDFSLALPGAQSLSVQSRGSWTPFQCREGA